MRTAFIALSTSLLAAVTLTAQPSQRPRGQAPDEVPDLRPAMARAEQAMNALQSALLARLADEMTRAGPTGAVSVCRDEAAAIATRVAREQSVVLGRTSHKLRNPANTPPAWAEALVSSSAGSKAAGHGIRVFDLGDRVGVVRPIGFVEMCASCHGAPGQIPAPVREIVTAAYPHDAAVGFAPGDLRGWMWAEVPKP